MTDEERSLVRREAAGIATRVAEFSDHVSFHAAVGRAALGGAAGAALAEVTSSIISGLFGMNVSSTLFALTVTTGSLAMLAARGKRWARAMIGGGLGAVGASLYLATLKPWPVFSAILLGASIAPVLAGGESKKRIGVAAVLGGILGMAGLFVGKWMTSVGLLTGIIPEPLATAAAGAAVGMFFGLASAPKHLARPSDPVESAFRDALQIKDGELHEVLARALAIQQTVRAELAKRKDEPTVQKLGQRVGELAMRILHIAEECRSIERDLSTAPSFELEERIESLRKKAEAAKDQAARATYLTAVESLDSQRRDFEAISRGRERVVARLHANVALLEKVRFSLIHLRSADAERVGGEASPLLEALEELSREIDATSTAVGEVFGKNALGDHRPVAALSAGNGHAQEPAAEPEPVAMPGVSDQRS